MHEQGRQGALHVFFQPGLDGLAEQRVQLPAVPPAVNVAFSGAEGAVPGDPAVQGLVADLDVPRAVAADYGYRPAAAVM